MKHRVLEFGKTILIILLVGSLLLLAMMAIPMEAVRNNQRLSRLLQPIAPLLGLPEAELTYVAAVLPVRDAAQPTAISVRSSAGRYTAMWDFLALDTTYETFGGFLGQALDTADTFTRATQAQIQSALSGRSIYFRYGCPLPPDLLASWLGAQLEADVPSTADYILALEQDSVTLYLVDEISYSAPTQLDPAALEPLLEQYRPDDSQFAFEANSSLSALSLLPGGTAAVPAVVVSDPCTSRYIEQLATDLGFNPYGESRYTDEQGTVHFSETNCALQIVPGGQILLTSSDETRFAASGPDEDALVETARDLVETASVNIPGNGRIYLSGLTREDGRTVCTFDSLVSGIPVALSSGHAATVTFSGQTVVQLTFRAYAFHTTNTELYPLPVDRTAALLPAGSALMLQYRITANQTLEAGWIN